MAVELVLKLLGRMPVDSFDQQEQWQNRTDGSFANYDNRVVNRLRFRCQFALPRDQNFPLENLFETITQELAEGRYVIASLVSPGGWHMFVIYDSTPQGEFKAITYIHGEDCPSETENVREVIRGMSGADILTYKVLPLGKIGRNEKYPCGSGIKFKKCCGQG